MAKSLRERRAIQDYYHQPCIQSSETAYIFAEEFGIKPDTIRTDNSLYYRADLKHLLNMLAGASNEINTITLFGHNPAITEMPDRLCKTGCEFLTKTSVVCISFQIKSWSEVKSDAGRSIF